MEHLGIMAVYESFVYSEMSWQCCVWGCVVKSWAVEHH